MNNRDVVNQFYLATQANSGAAILAALHPQFAAEVAPGMPSVTDFAPRGPEVALATVWGPVGQDFDIAPYAEAWYDTEDGAVLVTGHYRGTARATGKPVRAEFAHLWRVADGKISALHQYTDTWCWRAALAA
ncbi:nuclear transport factor 2 family protein [Nocardia brasiliensis]|uniref:nuclear transport factor 2 family protein n=1 Tax=Nocardia brasiliensis TaxID=37326 RepID=UPI0018946CEA|nr:nuclear transport factor 2 family protein [Nocardia brasiliensis]MBF6130922.1 nuclear transport factor 2 family protein [Nocardia brasiliensis]